MFSGIRTLDWRDSTGCRNVTSFRYSGLRDVSIKRSEKLTAMNNNSFHLDSVKVDHHLTSISTADVNKKEAEADIPRRKLKGKSSHKENQVSGLEKKKLSREERRRLKQARRKRRRQRRRKLRVDHHDDVVVMQLRNGDTAEPRRQISLKPSILSEEEIGEVTEKPAPKSSKSIPSTSRTPKQLPEQRERTYSKQKLSQRRKRKNNSKHRIVNKNEDEEDLVRAPIHQGN